jgi:hypothetical protein
MKATTIDKLIWIFLYGGLLGVGLGLSISRSDAALGWSVVTGGAITAVIGAVLVYVRSRVNEET